MLAFAICRSLCRQRRGQALITASRKRSCRIFAAASVIDHAESGHVAADALQQFRVAPSPSSNAYPGSYSMSARVQPQGDGHLRRTQAVWPVQELLRREALKVAHGLMYFMISMTALRAAILFWLWFAGRSWPHPAAIAAPSRFLGRSQRDAASPPREGPRRLSQPSFTMPPS